VKIFELFGSILLKDSGVESKLDSIDKKASGTSKSMGSSFGAIAGAALKVGAVIGLGMGFKEMIDKASAGEQKLAQMDAVLKSTKGAAGMTKDELLKLADAQGKLTTFSKGANMETENLLLTFTSIGKDVFPQALTTVNDMSQALGQDTKSSAVQLGKALQDPIKGITALSRVGVNFTEGQKKSIEAMVKHGDVAGAQKLILKELGTEFGGSAEAAGKTFAGQMTIAKNQVAGLGSTIGSALLPTLTGMITTINENMPKIKQVITDAVVIVTDKFKEWGKIIGQIASELFPSLDGAVAGTDGKAKTFTSTLDIVTTALSFVRDNLGFVKASLEVLGVVWIAHEGYILANKIALIAHGVVQTAKMIRDKGETAYLWLLIAADKAHTIATMDGSIATKAITAVQWLFNAAMDANPIGVVVIALAALGFAIYEVVKHWQDIVTWISKAWDWLKKWNGTPAEDKNSTVTTNYQSKGGEIPQNASGTDFFKGGLTHINELGGEIVNLPRGTQIIPHDVSMAMAKNSSNAPPAKSQQPVTLQLVLQNGKAVAEYLIDDINNLLGTKNIIKGRGVGV